MTELESNRKQKLLENPRAKALLTDQVKGGREVVDPKSDDPEKRFGVRTAEVKTSADIAHLLRIVRTSKTFAKAERQLRSKHVTVTVHFDPAVPRGGRACGSAQQRSRGIELWPPTVLQGYHILDVLIHEYGEVYSDYAEIDLYEFSSTVQKELGIRVTPDSHQLSPAAPAPAP